MQSEHPYIFADEHCASCQRRENDCQILAGAHFDRPIQWLKNRCTAHWPIGEKEPVQQCPNTLELPLDMEPIGRHEWDEDACCVHCGFDGAEWGHWKHHTYEGRASDLKQPLCLANGLPRQTTKSATSP